MAADETLDHHVAALGLSHREGGHDVFACLQVERHAPAMVAVGWLDHHRQANVLRGFPGFLGGGHDLPLRHRHAAGGQQAFGQVLVAGNAFGNCAGQIGFGCPDAALAGAVTELHQVAAVQPDVRDAAVGGGRHNGGGAGAQVAVIDFGADGFDSHLHVADGEWCVVDGGHQQRMAFGQRGAGHLLVPRPEHHAVHPASGGAARLAKAGRHVGQVQQLNHHVLQHMAGPGAFVQTLQKSAALAYATVVFQQRGQQARQAVIEARQQIGRKVFQVTKIQPNLQHGPVGPDVGAAQVIDAQQVDSIVVTHGWGDLA